MTRPRPLRDFKSSDIELAPIRTGVRGPGSGNIPASRVPPILRESAVEQRRPNHPSDSPFSIVALLYANDAAEVKLHDFTFFVACDK